MERLITRRNLLVGVATTLVGSALAGRFCEPSPKRTKDLPIRHDASSVLPGEWITRNPLDIIITNGGFEDVQEVNVRSHWNIMPYSQLDVVIYTVVGKIPVGTTIISLGEVKGLVGSFTNERASNIFFAVTNDELRRIGLRLTVNQPEQKIYYINSRYGRILNK